MEPFIAEVFVFTGETETAVIDMKRSSPSSEEMSEAPTATEVAAPEEPPAISGGLDRDIIRRVAKDHADEVEDAPVDQIEFNGHGKGVYPLIYIPMDDSDEEVQDDQVIYDDLIVDGSLVSEDTTDALIFA